MSSAELGSSVEIACTVKDHTGIRLISVGAAGETVQDLFSSCEGSGKQGEDKCERENYCDSPRHGDPPRVSSQRGWGDDGVSTRLPGELYTRFVQIP